MPFDQKPAPRMLPFAYKSKNFINYRTTANQIDESTTLESIRDMLKNLDAKRQPMDRVYSLKSCVVKFENHRPQIRRIVGKNQLSAPVYFSERGWQMFCDFILPSTGIRKGYRIQAQTPVADTNPLVPQQVFTRAESVATIDVNWWIRNYAPDRNILLRTVLTQSPFGEVERIVRSVQTPSYTVLDELEYCNLILDTQPELGLKPILKANIGSNGMWIRLLEAPQQKLELNKLVPTRDFWTSPTSLRKVGQGYGGIRLICTNGMTSHEKEAILEIRHSGDKQMIRESLRSNMQFQQAKRDGVMDKYNQALDVAIDDAWTWMENALGMEKVAASTVEKVRFGMRDKTSNPVGTLANVIDGMTLISQNTDDFDTFDSWDFERTASKVLSRGLRQAKNGKILVRV